MEANRKTALVTGATDGIGRATARLLVESGWQVVIVGRNAEKCRSTAAELGGTGHGRVEALCGDLASMADVRRVATDFRSMGTPLDLLLLNANAITQDHRLTADGFEANMAIGYFGRVLLTWCLEPVLLATPNSQVLSVVGLNLDRVDFEDLSMEKGYSDMKALGRWQWAMQVFCREYNRRGPIPMNTFMPGLVRTKILANEPQPMRAIVRVANVLMGIPVEKSAAEVMGAAQRVERERLRDAWFNRTRLKVERDLHEQAGDGARLWDLTRQRLDAFLGVESSPG